MTGAKLDYSVYIQPDQLYCAYLTMYHDFRRCNNAIRFCIHPKLLASSCAKMTKRIVTLFPKKFDDIRKNIGILI